MDQWNRDPGIAELIEYLDQPRFRFQPDKFTKKVRDAVIQEITRCKESFEYAARNYFWIQTKDNRDVPFRLWPAQEYLLDHIKRIQARNQPVKIQILKARQLGLSTVIEAIGVWKAMFFSNVRGIVIADTEDNSSLLFSIMLRIYDMLPWWMQPMIAARKYEEGIWFENPVAEMRRDMPGLNSRIGVQHSTQIYGIGSSRSLTFVHASEYADWQEKKALQTIGGDLRYAIAETPETLAFLESTGRRFNSYAHRLWLANKKLGELADWTPVFMPAFMEPTRVTAPPKGWVPETQDASMRDRIQREWLQCPVCRRWQQSDGIEEHVCHFCPSVKMVPFTMSDVHLFYYYKQRINAETRDSHTKGESSIRELRQELCVTPEECFQVGGSSIFSDEAIQYVNTTIRPPTLVGYFDSNGKIHGVSDQKTKQCYQPWCQIDHTYGENMFLSVWDFPSQGAEYVIGADVAEGLGGSADYSVAFVNRIGRNGSPDVQVALWRSNRVGTLEFAKVLVQLGCFYNEAMLSIEYNNYQTTADTVFITHQYPNLFRWKRYDTTTGFMTNKLHWLTKPNNRANLWQTAKSFLASHSWIIRSENFHHEMRFFTRADISETKVASERGEHDDELFAGFIAVYTAHDLEQNDSVYVPASQPSITEAEWTMTCMRCRHEWGAQEPKNQRCPACGSVALSGKRNNCNLNHVSLEWGDDEFGRPHTDAQLPYSEETYEDQFRNSGSVREVGVG